MIPSIIYLGPTYSILKKHLSNILAAHQQLHLKKEAQVVLQGKNPEAFEFEQGTSPHRSPRKNPEQGSPTQPEKSQFIRTSEGTVEIDMDKAAAVAAATATVTAAVVVYPATTETTATETTAVVTKAASNNNTNTRLNVQAHPLTTAIKQA